MSKSKRLMELMMAVNRKRKFTVKELAQEFGVSSRTILRDLQELGELGVPLYSEVGPHGGYQILKERILPPIAFTEEEAVAIFFASHALRHYASLPFEMEAASALNKFYSFMPSDVRERIDQMRNRVDFFSPTRPLESPYLPVLLEAALRQKVLRVDYASREGTTSRDIQPVGIYASHGLWYCPAYCFLRGEVRLFRCDRFRSIDELAATEQPIDLRHVDLTNRGSHNRVSQEYISIQVELTKEGAERCMAELWPSPKLHLRSDGTGLLEGPVPKNDLDFFAAFFIGLGVAAKVLQPLELIERIRTKLSDMTAHYI